MKAVKYIERPSFVDELVDAYRTSQQTKKALMLHTPQDATRYLGVGYLKALSQQAAISYPQAKVTLVVECGEYAVDALAAMRLGFTHIAVDKNIPSYKAVASIAKQQGVTLVK